MNSQICRATPSNPRTGVDIVMPGDALVEESEEWRVAGWLLRFVRLQADQSIPLDRTAGRIYLKVVTGNLVNPSLGPFAESRAVRTTRVEAAEVTAGPQGALFAIFTETDTAPSNIHAMSELAVEGPHAEVFVWQSFYDRFGQRVEYFKGVEAYMAPGFHLVDGGGAEMVYLNLWTMGKGGDASTHNHSQDPHPKSPAFAEIHWVFNNGSRRGGMYECDEVGGPRTLYVMQRGEEHGPFWVVDHDSGLPQLRDNGAVEYGWHGWQAGTDDNPSEAFDFVAAFEINPDYAPLRTLPSAESGENDE